MTTRPKPTGHRHTPRAATETPWRNYRRPTANFNAPRRDGVIAERSEPALHPRLPAREVPAAPEWMLRPLKPPKASRNSKE
jgi:hypothetical protein